eukprot:CAMPEP_0194036538 /NCGR_PEP_ID=MMETSP0009_2-20130614/8901_1 /TAXON_ID=210454 /ORGANISM="Grammatophora oceanica, Strain CCMP 410" /LENGTH=212 /DNA_ID=CAMNT_0038678341 /DNA_START=22 /DNA_END=660 /DNA_ORIENTATION=-
MTTVLTSLIALLAYLSISYAWTVNTPVSRREVLAGGTSAFVAALVPALPVSAFDGSGSSAYAGKSNAVKDADAYKARVIADAKDFHALGNAIDRGETDGDDWVTFFIQYPRREMDDVGRAYAANLDLVGEDGRGGAGFLLAGTFGKKGKPTETLPQMKQFMALSKTLPAVNAAGKSGDLAKAKKAYAKASESFSSFLKEVGLPESLSDPLYN